MSRLQVRRALQERFDEARSRLETAYEQFRESRLYVQTVCTAVLVGAACLVHLAPYGPLARAHEALRWAVAGDYDFAGRAEQANRWARAQGGWQPALAGLWQQGNARVRDWVGPVGARAGEPAAATPPAGAGEGGREAVPGARASGEATPQSPASPPLSLPPLQPVEGSVLWEYGWLPQGVGEEFHEGIDFVAARGTPVVAILDGTVVAIRPDNRLGTVIEVKHGEFVAVYAQVESVLVRAGDTVRRGQPIAAVARSTGAEENMTPHLHFEIRPVGSGEPVDPASYLGLGGKRL
ncbi:MAG: peptidoglycan DD-metalloendopeptidase family protein [Bacillota bacterium]